MIDMADYTKNARVEEEFIVTGYKMYERKTRRFIKADYNLGYVIGAYLSVGTSNIVKYKNSTRGMVFWYVQREGYEDQINNLKESLKTSFNLNMTIREQKKSSTYQIVCYSKPLATLLGMMGKKSGRKNLPDMFMYKDKSYKEGLLKGISDFDGHKPDSRNVLNKRKLSINVVELFNNLKMY